MVAICGRGCFLNSVLATLLSSSSINNNASIQEDNTIIQLGIASKYVRNQVMENIQQDPAVAGSLLRLAFHDAAVRNKLSHPNIGGSDGSIRYELEWSENRGLGKPLKIVQNIYDSQGKNRNNNNNFYKDAEQQQREKVLSFADVTALAGAAAVEAANGPKIEIKLGRKDINNNKKKGSGSNYNNQKLDRPLIGETERSTVSTSLPSAGLDSLGLRNYFGRLGFSEKEFVALMGAHDLGRHVTLTDMPKECLRNLTRTCLEEAPVLAPFVSKDPDTFSNDYYKTLLRWYDREIKFGEALFIPTDVDLVVDDGLKKYVVEFANDEELFFTEFSHAYQKLVENTATTSLRF